jgi:hypothetical protein
MITALRWADPEKTTLIGELDNGRIVVARANRIQQEWAEEFELFKQGGGAIAGYASPPKPPKRQLDEVPDYVRALALVLAQWSGKSPAQLRTAFIAAMDTLED